MKYSIFLIAALMMVPVASPAQPDTNRAVPHHEHDEGFPWGLLGLLGLAGLVGLRGEKNSRNSERY